MGENSSKNFADDKFYDHYYRKAFSIGRYFCHTPELAQEIAQLTAIKLFLWKDKVQNPDKWIYQVARNYSLQLMKKHKRDDEFQRKLHLENETKHYPSLLEMPKLDLILNDIPDSFLTDKEKEIARDYFVQGLNLPALTAKYEIPEKSISEHIYHIKQEIMLFLRLGKEFKVIPKIAGTHLNSNIMYFMKKLKHSLETQNFAELDGYMDNYVDLNNLAKTEKLIKIISYELRYKNPGEYKLFCSFVTDRNFPYSITFIISLIDHKKIKIISEPSLTTRVVKISPSALTPEAKLFNAKKINGEYILNLEEVTELVSKLKTTEIELKNFDNNTSSKSVNIDELKNIKIVNLDDTTNNNLKNLDDIKNLKSINPAHIKNLKTINLDDIKNIKKSDSEES